MAILAVPGSAAAEEGCANATLIGDYAFTFSGQLLALPPAAGPVSGVALTHFDGQGNRTKDSVARFQVLIQTTFTLIEVATEGLFSRTRR